MNDQAADIHVLARGKQRERFGDRPVARAILVRG
jgi:hypothetical protein